MEPESSVTCSRSNAAPGFVLEIDLLLNGERPLAGDLLKPAPDLLRDLNFIILKG